MSRASRLPALGVGPYSLTTTLPSSHPEGPLWPLLEAEIESHLALVQQELDRLIGDIRNVLGFEATEKTSANDVTAFDPTTVADLPGLLKVLKAEQDYVQELSNTLTINGIEDFATRMKILGQHHGCPTVEQWADHLTDAAGMFDLDGMSQTLNAYDDLIDQLVDP